MRARSLALPVALFAAMAAPAQGGPGRMVGFCAELERVIQAVELGNTAALERSRARPPDFGFLNGCGAQGGGWFCHQSLAPPALSLANLADGVARCRPDLVRLPQTSTGYLQFEGPGVALLIIESGAPRAHVGRIVTFSIEPRPSGQARTGRPGKR